MGTSLRGTSRGQLLTSRAMRHGRIAVLAACLAVAALAVFMGVHFAGGGSSPGGSSGPVGLPTGSPLNRSAIGPQHGRSHEEFLLSMALQRSVVRAATLGGAVEAAVMLDDSPAPIVATSEPWGKTRYMRMWSMSKVATMVALLRELGWGSRPGTSTSAEVDSALRGAITRSENCRQRRVVLELQHVAGGISAARQAMTGVFAAAGARPLIGSQVQAPESLCVPFLRTQTEIANPLGPAVLLGTSTWRVTDAVRFAHALAIGTYGRAISARVLALMRAPKRPSRESAPGELTAPLDWGAGAAFAGLHPAYKAGWGGSMNGNFLAGQIAVIPLATGGHLSVAVMFHPDVQPIRDDPGITAAPRALQSVMGAIRLAIGSQLRPLAHS